MVFITLILTNCCRPIYFWFPCHQTHLQYLKEHYSWLKSAYLIASYNNVPTVDRKYLVSFSPCSSLLSQSHPIKSPNFIIKHMFTAKSTTSRTSLPYGALLVITFQNFGINCSNEPSDFSSKFFDEIHRCKESLPIWCAPSIYALILVL